MSQQEIWRELCQTISANGGQVISRPLDAHVRFQCERDNPLPNLLRDCGFNVIPAGTMEVLWPVIDELNRTSGVAPTTVSVWQLQLEKNVKHDLGDK